MEKKSVLYKCIEVGATIVASLFVLPLMLIFVLITGIGALVYIPFHLYTVIKQSVQKP